MSIQSTFNYTSGQFVSVSSTGITNPGTTPTGSIALAGGTGSFMFLTNVGGFLAFAQVGGSTVTASNTSIPLVPGAPPFPLAGGTGQYLSAFTLQGMTGLSIVFGS